MKIPLIYLDTSIIGGCFDGEFQKWSNGLFMDIKNGFFKVATSDIVIAELQNAPETVKQKYRELFDYDVVKFEIDSNVEMLTDAYLGHKILTQKYKNDMIHIALATVHNADILVSWNFKHIVHFDKIAKFNAVNIEYGFRQLTIHSPREVTTYE
ncbi:MAG: PIN domain-containing protein [Chitinivibrionales bacterium]|nr:PIN domain-containing protein [Chitinivibrionales bacterium]